MAIAHQAEVLGAVNTVAGNYDTSITPAAAPNGVVVVIVYNSVSDLVTSVTYGTGAGAVPLARRRINTESTEAGCVQQWWAGDSNVFPSGAQTVRIVRTGTTSMRASIATLTVAAGKVVAVDSDASGLSASVANPSWIHASTNPNVQAYLGIHSGLTTMTSTPATGWTLWPAATGFEDYGQQGRGWAQRSLATPGSLGAGWTAATADDFVGASIAFYEADPPAAIAGAISAAVAGHQTTAARQVPTIIDL